MISTLAAWSQGSTICVLLLGFYFINVTWPPQPPILMASMISFFFVIDESFGVTLIWFFAYIYFLQIPFGFQSKNFKNPDFWQSGIWILAFWRLLRCQNYFFHIAKAVNWMKICESRFFENPHFSGKSRFFPGNPDFCKFFVFSSRHGWLGAIEILNQKKWPISDLVRLQERSIRHWLKRLWSSCNIVDEMKTKW